MSIPWIGLTGKMAVGKDYTYEKLEKIDSRFARVSFADEVRYEIIDRLGVDDVPVFWDKPYSEEIRRLLQWWGTELRRAHDPDHWVKKAEETATRKSRWRHRDGIGYFPVFTDVRFPNEANMIRRNGGVIVKLKAMEHTRHARGATASNHRSETAMDNYPADLELWNEDGFDAATTIYRFFNLDQNREEVYVV